MEGTITTGIVIAYSQCPRKAYLLLFGSDKGEPHEYTLILEEQRKENQKRYTDHLKDICADVQPYTLENFHNGKRVLINAHLRVDGFATQCGILTRIEGKSTFGKHSYEPSITVGTYNLNKEQKLELSFVGFVLKNLQQTPPSTGKIIGMNGTSHTVKLDKHSKDLRSILEPLRKWTTVDLPKLPPILLNRHCSLCPFQRVCLAHAEQDDNLSLLDGVTARVIRKYERKGIFTVKQLSYHFRPRKCNQVNSKPRPVTHKIELQALAIREKKIYLQELPALSREPVELFLDMEGIPDRGLYYLIGLLVCHPDTTEHHVFWADTDLDECHMWQQFLVTVMKYPEVKIYHYGSYEPRAIAQLARRYDTDAESVTKRLVNVNSYVYGKVYFPVRSNGLKSLGRFLGAAWTDPQASGLQSLVWRHRWETTRDEQHRQLLLRYNHEDCEALRLLVDRLCQIGKDATADPSIEFASRPKRHVTETGKTVHDQFERILRSAHQDSEGRSIRIGPGDADLESSPRKRGARKGHKTFRRITPKASRVVIVPSMQRCSKCHGDLAPDKGTTERTVIDLIFTRNGCRKTITKYTGQKAYCSKCGYYCNPPCLHKLYNSPFGHGLQAWVVYQRIVLRLPYRIITQVMEHQFGVGMSDATIVSFLGYLAEYYAPTEAAILSAIRKSDFVHVDETKINIQGVDHYVWVFTDGQHVVFRMTETREAGIVRDVLAGYKGVLVSDFYPGYDAVPCRQQKCLVHLIRDINNDLRMAPFDKELEAFAVEVQSLLVPILTAVDLFGLKAWHLQKFEKNVERFYDKNITEKEYRSEAAETYRKRFDRYRDSLFTFLTLDGIPWENNMAERAIRQLAVQRKISGSFFKRVASQYLLLLAISQTCRFQGKSFLKFLLSKETDVDYFRRTSTGRLKWSPSQLSRQEFHAGQGFSLRVGSFSRRP